MVAGGLKSGFESPLTTLGSDDSDCEEISRNLEESPRNESAGVGAEEFSDRIGTESGGNDDEVRSVTAVDGLSRTDSQMHPQELESDQPMQDITCATDQPTINSNSQLPSTQPISRQNFVTTKGWTLQALLDSSQNFTEVKRVSAAAPPDEILKAISQSEKEGIPLIISGFHELESWPKDNLFSADWLVEHGPPCK